MNATQFCELVENRLGWQVKGERWRGLMAEAGKVKRKIASNPSLYTWENLRLTVELLAKEKKPRTPVGVFAHVERALDLALDQEDDTETQIREVMKFETMRGDPQGWAVRFARADGPFREILLGEWRESAR